MASTDLTKEAALPPGAANVEDDVKAFEAEERRGKLKLMAARIVLAVVLLAVWEYGTDRWFDALWFSSPLRVARHFVIWVQDDLISHLLITLRECFIGYTVGTLAGIFTSALLARLTFSARCSTRSSWRSTASRASRWRRCSSFGSNRRAVKDRSRRHAVILPLLLCYAFRAAQRRPAYLSMRA
jgi:hypothetical protein